MKINVKVHPGAKIAKVVDGDIVEAWVAEKPDKNKANQALIKAIAKHFSIPKNKVKIVKGLKSRKKIVEVDI